MDLQHAVTKYLAVYEKKRRALQAGLENVQQKKAVRSQTLMQQDDVGKEILAKKKSLEQQWDARCHELLMADHKGVEILARQGRLKSELAATNGNGMVSTSPCERPVHKTDLALERHLAITCRACRYRNRWRHTGITPNQRNKDRSGDVLGWGH